MKRLLSLTLLLALMGTAQAAKVYHMPYLRFGRVDGTLAQVAEKLEESLATSKFELQGRYSPAADENNMVITMTHPDLREAVDQAGEYGVFALGFRVGLRKVDGQVEVTSQNPPYWSIAYMQRQYSRAEGKIASFQKQLEEAVGRVVPGKPEGFGHRKGLEEKKLEKYHYMVFMPYLTDSVTLASGSEYSYEETLATIEKNLADEVGGAGKVYRIESPKHGATLFGVSLHDKEVGEPHFVPIIDFDEPRHTPFLPYEILVTRNRAICLHGRFRIALSFPALTMTTFTKIMSTPGDISDALTRVVTPQNPVAPEGN